MTRSAVAFTNETDSTSAGRALGEKIRAGLGNESPDAVIVFASAQYDYGTLLEALHESCTPAVLVGCSSAGEFTSGQEGEGSASAVGLRSSTIQFSGAIARNLRQDRRAAALQIARGFRGVGSEEPRHRAALVLADALAGYTDDFVDQLSVATGGAYAFFGGGAGANAPFTKSHVFYGTEAVSDAAVALEILSERPVAVGVSHGWLPAGEPLRVTAAGGNTVVTLNDAPAVEAFESHARDMGQHFDRNDPVPFFLHNVLGIETASGHKLRVPLSVLPDGSISCASTVPLGSTLYIMKTGFGSAAEAAMNAATAALDQLQGTKPEVALFFDCVSTRLRIGGDFGLEIDALQRTLGQVPYAGCNTFGQIARSEGQFSGFHNCTATIALLPS